MRLRTTVFYIGESGWDRTTVFYLCETGWDRTTVFYLGEFGVNCGQILLDRIVFEAIMSNPFACGEADTTMCIRLSVAKLVREAQLLLGLGQG